MIQRAFWTALMVTGLTLSGCGGGGTNAGSSNFVAPKIPIGWPARARQIDGTSSALSVVVTFENAGSTRQNVSFEADRLTAPAAYTQTYTSSSPVRVGVQGVHVDFYSLAGGVGSIVAESDVSLKIGGDGSLSLADGSPLGSVQASGTIQFVRVTGPSLVSVGATSSIIATALDGGLNVVAVSPGSFFYQLVNETGTATLNASGQIVGSTVGTISVTATVDGIQSSPFGLSVSPPLLSMSSLAQPTAGMVYDPQTGHLWATVPATAPNYANCVIEIDPVAQQIVSHIPVGSSPTVIAISDDGTALYVGLQGSDSFARVDPIGKSVIATYAVNPNVNGFGANSQYATSIAIEPGDPDVVALCQQDQDDSGFVGGCIYNQGVLLPTQMGIYDGSVLAFTSPTTLWGSDPGFSPETLYQGSVSPTGASLTNSNRGLGGDFWVYGGNLYFNNGQVVSGANGALLGTFPLTEWASGAAVDVNNQVAYLIGQTQVGGEFFEIGAYSASAFTLIASYGVPNGPAAVNDFVLLASGGFAFGDGTNVYFLSAPTPPAIKFAKRSKP